MSNRPLMFLGVFFVLIGISKLGYALVMKNKE